VEYFVDVDPWSSDYSNVYVYPELVMPNYTGLIAIRGLMNNSNIVITDNDGNVVKTLTSVGGNVTWDGCDETGNRVKTGSYKVFASQQEPDLTAEPVTRISMIK
jgi:flagellar hook assembly protein FlgD